MFEYRIKDLVGVASLAKLGKDIITSHLEAKNEPSKLEELCQLIVRFTGYRGDGKGGT